MGGDEVQPLFSVRKSCAHTMMPWRIAHITIATLCNMFIIRAWVMNMQIALYFNAQGMTFHVITQFSIVPM